MGSDKVFEAFHKYLVIREQSYGQISKEQIDMLVEDLCSLATKEEERIAIINKASAGGYKSFFNVNKPKKDYPRKSNSKKTKFNNFEERDYNMTDLESKLFQ